MSEVTKQQEQSQANEEVMSNNASGDVETSTDVETSKDEASRKTGVAVESDAKPTATPEAPENDSVVGSPNQGTESR